MWSNHIECRALQVIPTGAHIPPPSRWPLKAVNTRVIPFDEGDSQLLIRGPLGLMAMVGVSLLLATIPGAEGVIKADDGTEKTPMAEEAAMNMRASDASEPMKMSSETDMSSGEIVNEMQGGMAAGAPMMMDMGRDSWQDNVNRVTYPITAILALVTALICWTLIRATGMTDKFGLITAGLAVFVGQSVLGVLFYVTDGAAISMGTLMLMMSLLNSVALGFIALAFFKWRRMLVGAF